MTNQPELVLHGWMTVSEAAKATGMDVWGFVRALDGSGKAIVAGYPHEYADGGWLGVARFEGHAGFTLRVVPGGPVPHDKTMLITHVVRAGLQAWAAYAIARECRPGRNREEDVRARVVLAAEADR